MVIFPAIDIRGGKCVRLVNGDFERETIYSENPADMAQKWEAQGAHFLHVVDLDGARAKRPVNLSSVKAIIDAVNIPVQIGGGIRSFEAIEACLKAGAARVILGTKAVTDPAFLDEAIAKFGNRIAVLYICPDPFGKFSGQGFSSAGARGHMDRLMFCHLGCDDCIDLIAPLATGKHLATHDTLVKVRTGKTLLGEVFAALVRFVRYRHMRIGMSFLAALFLAGFLALALRIRLVKTIA